MEGPLLGDTERASPYLDYLDFDEKTDACKAEMGMGLPIGVILNKDKKICSGKTSIISAKLAECPLGMRHVRLGEKKAEVPTCPSLPTSQLSGQVRPLSQGGSRHKTG